MASKRIFRKDTLGELTSSLNVYPSVGLVDGSVPAYARHVSTALDLCSFRGASATVMKGTRDHILYVNTVPYTGYDTYLTVTTDHEDVCHAVWSYPAHRVRIRMKDTEWTGTIHVMLTIWPENRVLSTYTLTVAEPSAYTFSIYDMHGTDVTASEYGQESEPLRVRMSASVPSSADVHAYVCDGTRRLPANTAARRFRFAWSVYAPAGYGQLIYTDDYEGYGTDESAEEYKDLDLSAEVWRMQPEGYRELLSRFLGLEPQYNTEYGHTDARGLAYVRMLRSYSIEYLNMSPESALGLWPYSDTVYDVGDRCRVTPAWYISTEVMAGYMPWVCVTMTDLVAGTATVRWMRISVI